MAKIFLEATDNESTITMNGASVYGFTGDQVVTVAAKGLTVDAAVERVEFSGAMSEYSFKQLGPNALEVTKGDTVTKVFVQADANGTQLTFGNGTVNAIVSASAMTLGGTTVSTTGGAVTPATIDTTIKSDDQAPVTGLNLTVDQDNLVGTAGKDVFVANIFDNQNTFQSGDVVNGGADTDSLYAEVGNSQAFAITAKTSSLENIFIQAQTVDSNDDADNFNTYPEDSPLGDKGYVFSYNGASHDSYTQIDAGDMQGARQFWSNDSRANLVIEDVSVDSHLTTIGMRDTDPGNVNYEVYFDPQNITRPGDSAEGATLTIRLADVLDLGKGGDGLSNLPYSGFTLNVGSQSYDLAIDFAAITSYDDFAARIEAALAAKGLTGITVAESPAETAVFSITVTDAGTTYLQGTVGGVYNPIVLTNAGAENLSLVGYTLLTGMQEPSGNIVRTASQNEAGIIPTLTQVDVILDNVARGDASGSGDLVIGDMSESGIQQFNIQVDRTSHIDQLASTNNVLEVVNVTNDFTANPQDTHSGVAGANGGLIINELYDVRVFDASDMVGDVTLSADLTQNVTPKYLNLQDTQADPAGDNSEIPYQGVVDTQFSYDLGSGDDTLQLAISASNLEAAGTTTREDFVLEVNGNAGNDAVTFFIYDEGKTDKSLLSGYDLATVITDSSATVENAGNRENWYDNSILNTTIVINTQAGDDVVNKPGSGNIEINLGSGNDVVYADNAGSIADKWVFNANDANSSSINNLESDANNKYKLYKADLTVTFKGFESVVTIASTEGFTTDLQINQAIKEAINGNAVLSTMLVAKDGPSNTLVVTSLIDDNNAGNLSLNIKPTTLSTADVTLLDSFYGTTGVDYATIFNQSVQQITLKGDYDVLTADVAGPPARYSNVYGTGAISEFTSDNVITGDTGNDVLILGTGKFSNDTIVYKGYDQTADGLNDHDTVVNFDTGNIPTISVSAPITTGRTEQFTATFADLVPTAVGTTFAFDGATINLNNTTTSLIPAKDVVNAFVDQFNTYDAGSLTNAWTILSSTATSITFQSTTALTDVTNATAASFVLTNATGPVTVGSYVEGVVPFVAGSKESFVVDFNNGDTTGLGSVAAAAGTITFDGATVNYVKGDGVVSLATKLAAGTFTDYTAAVTADGVVTFTAKANGNLTDATTAQFENVANGIHVTPLVITQGVADAGATFVDTTITLSGFDGMDKIDFSSYNVDSVYVDATVLNSFVVGTTPGVNKDYIVMVESTTNDGEYTIYLVNTGADGYDGMATSAADTDFDATVGVIGVVDFGKEQSFIAPNFIV